MAQVTQAYGPKFKTLYDFMESTDGKLKVIGDVHTNNDLNFEDFKNTLALKTKIMQESVS
jgi:CII-binding regulator of phage lambda lysogenization HflD